MTIWKGDIMARTVGIGRQDFEKIRIKNNFYVDKTHFIKEWWEADDKVFQLKKKKDLSDTVNTALKQIEDMNYEAALIARGIPVGRIRKYGFAFGEIGRAHV